MKYIIFKVSKAENLYMFKKVFVRLCYQEIENQLKWELEDEENGFERTSIKQREEIREEMRNFINQLMEEE